MSEKTAGESGKIPIQKFFPLIPEIKQRRDGPFALVDPDDVSRFSSLAHLVAAELRGLPVEARLARAIEVGFLTKVGDKSWSFFDGRPVVFAKTFGQNIPFYRSRNGMTGKEAGSWYPFFGIGNFHGVPWFIKHEETVGLGFFTDVSGVLNRSFNWEHAIDLNFDPLKSDEHPFARNESTRAGYMPASELNVAVFGQDLSDIPERKRYEDHISDIVEKMLQKLPREEYDAIGRHHLERVKQFKQGLTE